MQGKNSNKSGRTSAISPLKQRNGNGIVHSQTMVEDQFIVLDRDLVRGLSEKEVEIDHLRTQIVALSEKAEVLEDMRLDVYSQKEMLRGSEGQRYIL